MDYSYRAEQTRTWKRSIQLGRERVEPFLNLLFALVRRDLISRYRRSLLGPAWAILQPLVLMVVFSIVRGVVDIPSEGYPYVLFTYSALVPWTFFSNAVVTSGPSILTNRNVIKKMAMAREVFPLAAVCTASFDFIMAGIVLGGMMIYYQVAAGWSLLWLPILYLVTAVLAFAVGMIIAALGTYKMDLVISAPFLMQFWLFATPVMYPLSEVPERWRSLYMLNPMVGVTEGFRDVLIKGQMPALGPLGWSVLTTLAVLAITWPLFRWLSQYFADVL